MDGNRIGAVGHNLVQVVVTAMLAACIRPIVAANVEANGGSKSGCKGQSVCKSQNTCKGHNECAGLGEIDNTDELVRRAFESCEPAATGRAAITFRLDGAVARTVIDPPQPAAVEACVASLLAQDAFEQGRAYRSAVAWSRPTLFGPSELRFPYPIPPASGMDAVSPLFHVDSTTTVAEAADRLREGLARGSYGVVAWAAFLDGFAVLTYPEKIDGRGAPACVGAGDGCSRFSTDFVGSSDNFLVSLAHAFGRAPVRYRSFLFMVTREVHISMDSGHRYTADEVAGMARGQQSPPATVTANRQSGVVVHCAVYIFHRDDAASEARLDADPVSVRDALRQAGIAIPSSFR
jgi:hypothetical protein